MYPCKYRGRDKETGKYVYGEYDRVPIAYEDRIVVNHGRAGGIDFITTHAVTDVVKQVGVDKYGEEFYVGDTYTNGEGCGGIVDETMTLEFLRDKELVHYKE